MRYLKSKQRVSLESIDVDDLPDVEAIDVPQEGIIEAQANIITLESSLGHLIHLESAATQLAEGGISEEIIAEQLSGPVVTAIECVEEGGSEEVSLEADNPTGFWAKVKQTANRIWEAIKKAIISIKDWFLNLFQKRESVSLNKQVAVLRDWLKKLTLQKADDLVLKNEWCINDERTSIDQIISACRDISKFSDFSDKFATSLLKDTTEVIANYKDSKLTGESLDIGRIDKIERAEKKLGFTSVDEIEKRYEKVRFTNFVGFTVKGTEEPRSAKAPDDAKIPVATKKQCEEILDNVQAKLDADTRSGVEKILQDKFKQLQKDVESLGDIYDAAGKLDKELIEKIRTLPTKVNAVFSVLRKWFIGTDIKSTVNTLSFVRASIKASLITPKQEKK